MWYVHLPGPVYDPSPETAPAVDHANGG